MLPSTPLLDISSPSFDFFRLRHHCLPLCTAHRTLARNKPACRSHQTARTRNEDAQLKNSLPIHHHHHKACIVQPRYPIQCPSAQASRSHQAIQLSLQHLSALSSDLSPSSGWCTPPSKTRLLSLGAALYSRHRHTHWQGPHHSTGRTAPNLLKA